MATSVPLLETSGSINVNTPAGSLFAKIQTYILSKQSPFHIGHMWVHSDLPVNITVGQAEVGAIMQQDPVSLAFL